MAFSETWVEADPDGSVIPVSQLDDYIRATKRQIRERLEGNPTDPHSGIFESGGFGTASVIKAGTARAHAVVFSGLGALPLQDGRIAITTDTNRLYHLKGSGAVELAYAPLDGSRHFTGVVSFDAGIGVNGIVAALGFSGPLVGSASSLSPGRNINGVLFDGTVNVTVPAAAATLTGATLAATVLASSLTSVGTLASLGVTGNVVAGGSVAKLRGTEADFVITAAQLGTGIFLLTIRNTAGSGEKGLYLVWCNGTTITLTSVSNTANAAATLFNGDIIPVNAGTYTWGVIKLSL